MIKTWTVTTTGPLQPAKPYFIRLSKTGDPNAAISYNLGNGGPDADQRAVMDAGFLELPRLGVLPADDPTIASSLDAGRPGDRQDHHQRAGLLPLRRRHTGHRGRVRRLQRRRLDVLHRRRASRGRATAPIRRRPRGAAPGTSGRSWPASGPSTRSPPGTAPRPSDLWTSMAGHRVRRRADPRTGLGEPRSGRLTVRHRTRMRVDRLPERQGRRQRLPADLVGGAVRPAVREHPRRPGHRTAGGHHPAVPQAHPGRHRR